MPPRLRIGLVGCGGIAHRHIAGYRAITGEAGEVVAGCDPDGPRLREFCERYGLPHRFATPADLIASGTVDVIALLTPPAVRAEVIVPAAQRGIHLLVEKPFAENLADAEAFVEEAERAGVMLAVNQQLRFMPDVLALKDVLDRGEIGEPRLVVHDHFQDRAKTGGWRALERRLEISIFSIHLLDRIRWLAGRKPVSVTARTRALDPAVRGETSTCLGITFAGGAVGTMVSTWHALGIPECRLRVDGTAGSALSEKRNVLEDAATLTIQRAGSQPLKRDCTRKDAFTLAMGESMKRLLEAVQTGVTPDHSGRDNLQTMWIVDAAYRSAERDGETVRI